MPENVSPCLTLSPARSFFQNEPTAVNLTAMPYRVYPMDTFFTNSIGRYPFDVRCEIAAELGFDATYLTCWSDQSWTDAMRLKDVKRTHGLDVAAVYGVADLTALDARLLNLIETFEGCDTIELAIKSAPDDDAVVTFLSERILPIAERRNLRILLYPHINFYVERTHDAARLCERIKHPNLGAMFCGFHWYAVDGKQLGESLAILRPYLQQVNLCGSRRDPDGLANKATIEPLDEGEMDNFLVLGHLRKLGYSGMIGFQGYSTGGDAYAKLKRSLAAFRDMEARLERHPHWAEHL
jgi:sugar phosphate isomerase/epimerase